MFTYTYKAQMLNARGGKWDTLIPVKADDARVARLKAQLALRGLKRPGDRVVSLDLVEVCDDESVEVHTSGGGVIVIHNP